MKLFIQKWKKKKIIPRLLAIKSDRYNSDFHLDYQRQKRNSPLIKSHNDFPKINNTLNKNILLDSNLLRSSASLSNSRNSFSNNLKYNCPYLETEQIYYPKIFQNNFYLRDKNSTFKKKIQKKENNDLSLKYLELIQEPKEYDYIYINELIQNEDNFFENELIENIADKNLKENILEQLQIYKEEENKIMENFVRKTLNKNQNESFLLIEKIPQEEIEYFAKNIYKEILLNNNNKEKEKKENELIKLEINNDDENNNKSKKNELIIHNIFLEFALENTRKKIQIRNQ